MASADPTLNFFDEYDLLGNVPDVDEPHAPPFYQNWVFYPVVCVTLLVLAVFFYLLVSRFRRVRMGAPATRGPAVSCIRAVLATGLRHLTPMKVVLLHFPLNNHVDPCA